MVTKEEVRRAVFSMKAYKSSVPDGFPPAFFQHFWEVVKLDLLWAAQDFFRTRKLLKKLNKTFIALIPKVKDPGTLSDFNSISLCNTTYKIFSKIIVNRLKPLLHKFIGKTQNEFVLGCQIIDAAITTHEVLHSMEKSDNPSMALKLDISKAYDRINWTFLYEVTVKIGFSQKVIRMVKSMIEIVNYLVMVNGSPWGNFGGERGLRQGDPISPYLFIMVAEVLGSLFLRKMEGGEIKGIKPTSTLLPEVIQQFVDDTFLSEESFVCEVRA